MTIAGPWLSILTVTRALRVTGSGDRRLVAVTTNFGSHRRLRKQVPVAEVDIGLILTRQRRGGVDRDRLAKDLQLGLLELGLIVALRKGCGLDREGDRSRHVQWHRLLVGELDERDRGPQIEERLEHGRGRVGRRGEILRLAVNAQPSVGEILQHEVCLVLVVRERVGRGVDPLGGIARIVQPDLDRAAIDRAGITAWGDAATGAQVDRGEDLVGLWVLGRGGRYDLDHRA